MIKKIGLMIAIMLLVGCSFFSKKPNEAKKTVLPKKNIEARKLFEQSILLMESENYAEAIKTINKLLKKHPSSNFELMSIYNLGGAYEAMGKCGTAVNRYRKIIKTSKGKFPRLEAQALLRMSYGHECLGRDDKVVATLLDATKRSQYLSNENRLAEVPARLAAAYSRLGNRKLAQKYFIKAQNGLKKLNSEIRTSSRKKEILSRTFFYMGEMKRQDIKKIGGEAYVRSVMDLQVFSLRSVELDNKEWSSKAADQIILSYDNIWNHIQGKGPGKVKKKSIFHSENWGDLRESLALKTLESLKYLKAQRFPDEKEPELVKKLFRILDEQEKRFVYFLAEQKSPTQKTPEALERESIKMPGRTYKPNPVLELESQKLIEKKVGQ